MKMTLMTLSALAALAMASPARTDDVAPAGLPKVIQISREMIKVGHGAAHSKTEAGWPVAFRAAKTAQRYFAMTSVTGPGEAWFVTPFPSYAAIEAATKADEANATLTADLGRLLVADAEHLSGASSIFASLREDLSYRSLTTLADQRYVQVTTFHIKPGHVDEWVAMRKLTQAWHEKLNMDEHWTTFQVTSGGTGNTYLMFIPFKAMADLDAAAEMHGKKYTDAMGDDAKKMNELASASIDHTDLAVFALDPKLSYAPAQWEQADAFWAPKPGTAVKAVARAKATTPAPAEKQPK
jgi:hypothetical protein